MKNSVRNQLQHILNPLHVYCRLKEAGMTEPVAKKVSETYERAVYKRILATEAAPVK